MEKLKIFWGENQDFEANATAQLQRRRKFGRRKSQGHAGKKKPEERSIGEMIARAKEHRAGKDDMHSRIPVLVSEQTVPDLTVKNKSANEQGCRRFNSLMALKPVAGSSIATKQLSNHEKYLSLQSRYISWSENRTGLDSRSPNKEPCLSRRFSSISLFSDRPSNIPVLIRNNNVRLRKYSCPDFYPTQFTKHSLDEEGGLKELEAVGFLGRTETSLRSTNVSKLSSKAVQQQNRPALSRDPEQLRTSRKQEDHARGKPGNFKNKPIQQQENTETHSVLILRTDLNGNEVLSGQKQQLSSSSSDDLNKGYQLEFFEKESLQSYSLNEQPLKKTSLPKMYSSKSNVLKWLVEVDHDQNYPQLWS